MLLFVEVAASIWLAGTHGIGWVILAWVTWLPLVVLPFLAGGGVAFIIALAGFWAGSALASIPDRKETA